MSALLTRFADLRRDDPGRVLIHQPGLGRTFSAADLWAAHLALAERLTRGGVSRDQLVVSAVGNAAAK